MNPKVFAYLNDASAWKAEMECLRNIVSSCALDEDFKWGVPCYCYKNSNVVLLHSFKNYCAILFVKGALLSDPNKILVQQSENTQAGRQIRFTSVKEVLSLEADIKAYIYEAIEIEKAGLKVDFKQSKELTFVEELQEKLDADAGFNAAFMSLTPGRQRAYNLFFSDPKQATTRISRIEKSTTRILKGKGLNDCVCGLSKKMPSCDGSHKSLKQID
jgi:uncharacterized protein YdeI (YjbR/CyaY-like superfamily)